MTPSLSIIIPAFNEEKRLPATLERLKSYLASSPYRDAEILVVDDGSRDGTVAAAERAGARVLRNPGNRGKGYSVRNGMLDGNGAWLLFTDADLSAPIDELPKLFDAATRSGARVAFGSRAVDRSLVGVHQAPLREYAGRFFNLVMRMATGLPYLDTQCGFKLFEREAAREIFSRQRIERFGFDVEVLFIAQRLGIPAVEVPVRWDNVEGSKVGMFSGLDGFVDLWRVRRNAWRGDYR